MVWVLLFRALPALCLVHRLPFFFFSSLFQATIEEIEKEKKRTGKNYSFAPDSVLPQTFAPSGAVDNFFARKACHSEQHSRGFQSTG